MSKSEKQTRKRKATSPLHYAPDTEYKTQRVKTNDTGLDQTGEPIKLSLSKDFEKITIHSGRKENLRTKKETVSKDSTPMEIRKTRSRTIQEENKRDDQDSENMSNASQSTTQRVTRQSARKRQENQSVDDDIYVYDQKIRSLSASRSNKKEKPESVRKRAETKSKERVSAEDEYSTPQKKTGRTPRKSSATKDSSAKKSVHQTRRKNNSLKEIEERPSGESSPVHDIPVYKMKLEKKKKAEESKPKQRKPKNKFEEILEKFDDAILKLQEYTLPNEIPCREGEKTEIKNLILEGLKNQGETHCLYISGVPGIGKTVSVLEVIKQLKEEYENEELDFNFIHVNGLGLPNPENAYQTILRGIVDINDASNSSACVILNNIFQKGSLPKAFKQHKESLDTRTRLILLDELDYLVTKDQNLLYNLFDWPHCKHAKLIIIGVANTMNLPEQLQPKITSRMGNRRLVYKPYSSQQIEKILLSRIDKMDIIRPDAITFLSKKIATFSSDIRRTLHVCREALKLCRDDFISNYTSNPEKVEDKGLLTLDYIRKSYDQIYSTPYHKCIKMLMENCKLLLLAICLEMKVKGQGFANLAEVQDRLKGMLNNLGRKPLHHSETKQLFSQLVCLGLVLGKSKAMLKKDSQSSSSRAMNIMDTQITLKISLDDITNALKDDNLISRYVDLL